MSNTKDNDKARFWLARAADKGLAEAQYYLGLLEENEEVSLIWKKRAVSQGYSNPDDISDEENDW